jgi:spore maturation protein CgeB
MAKILLIQPGPDFSVADVHRGWLKALRKLGHDVMSYATNDRLAFYGQILFNDLTKEACDKCGRLDTRKAVEDPLAIAQLATAGVLEACYEFNPDIVFFISAFFQNMNTLSLLRKRGVKVVMLHTESPYQDEEQLARGTLSNLNIVNDPTNMERWAEKGPAAYFPHSYDPDVHYPAPLPRQYESDFTFVGTAFNSRCEFFSAMNFDGLNISLGGNGWDSIAPKHRKLYDYLGHRPDKCVDNDETARVYRVSKTGINFYRREGEEEHEGEGWSMGPREVEMAACGLFFVRDPRPESDETFPMLPVFSSPREAEELLRYYIDHDEKRENLADEARAAIQNWTFDNRAKDACILMERIGIL